MRSVTALLLCCCLGLASCGWHLRGTVALPPNVQSIYLDDRAGNINFSRQFERLLQSNGVTLAEQYNSADLIIEILEFNEEQRINSVSSSTIVSEYEIITSVEYEVKNAVGAVLLESNRLSQSRPYTFDQNAVVSASQEAQLIQRELQLDLAQQILRSLRFINP